MGTVVPMHQMFSVMELFTTITIIVILAGDLAATLEVALKKLHRLKKIFQQGNKHR